MQYLIENKLLQVRAVICFLPGSSSDASLKRKTFLPWFLSATERQEQWKPQEPMPTPLIPNLGAATIHFCAEKHRALNPAFPFSLLDAPSPVKHEGISNTCTGGYKARNTVRGFSSDGLCSLGVFAGAQVSPWGEVGTRLGPKGACPKGEDGWEKRARCPGRRLFPWLQSDPCFTLRRLGFFPCRLACLRYSRATSLILFPPINTVRKPGLNWDQREKPFPVTPFLSTPFRLGFAVEPLKSQTPNSSLRHSFPKSLSADVAFTPGLREALGCLLRHAWVRYPGVHVQGHF